VGRRSEHKIGLLSYERGRGEAVISSETGQGLQAQVAERLDNLKGWKVQYWAPFVLGMMMMGDSWDITVVAYVMPSLRAEWGLEPMQMGYIISAGFFGQLIGALSFGPLAERFGRIKTFSFAVVVMSILSIACGLVHDPDQFLWLRFFQGIGFGGAAPVCASYINELAPTKTRGRYFSIFQFLMVAGFSLCAVAAAIVIPTLGWRWMFFIAAFPILFVPFILVTLPESPRWLARFGRVEATNKALVKLGAPPLEGNFAGTVQEEAPRIPVKALFSREARWLTIFTCALWFFTSLVAYGFSTWTPTLYVDIYHLTIEQSLRFTAIIGVIYMFSPLVFAAIIDRVGRRPPGIVMAGITLATLIALTLLNHTNEMLSILLIGFGWIMSGAGFVLLWPYTSEIFPTHMRSTAVGLCSAASRVGAMLTPLVVAGVLSSTGSIALVFAVLGLGTFLVLMLWLFTSKEMARKRLDDLGDVPH
jgi:putative MFS transporter